jgi:hypothetical protein
VKSFDLPPEDDSDDGAPLKIEHGVDYMFASPKTLEFIYNYINYTWKIGAETITARAYLDDIGDVSLFAEVDGVATFMTPDKLEAAKFQPTLALSPAALPRDQNLRRRRHLRCGL